MPVWLQLKQSKYLTDQGKNRQYYPGDWVQVGKQVAKQWIADGTAISPYPNVVAVEEPEGTCGIMAFGPLPNPPEVGVPVCTEAVWELRWGKTCFWNTHANVNHAMYGYGFNFLSRWEMAVPLWDYRHLASEEGEQDERADTARIIRDLRVPVYDTRLIFAKRCDSVRRLFELWEHEGMTRLSFLRALYRVKPLILALPVTWTGQWAPGRG